MESRSAGFHRLMLEFGTKHVAAFIRLFKDAGSIPATSTTRLAPSSLARGKPSYRVTPSERSELRSHATRSFVARSW